MNSFRLAVENNQHGFPRLDRRNQKVTASSRCEPAAGLRQLKPWLARHKLTELVELRLQGRTLVVERQQAAIEQALELAGCYVVVTDVASERMSGQRVHDHYVSLPSRLLSAGLVTSEARSEATPLVLNQKKPEWWRVDIAGKLSSKSSL